MGTSHQIQKNTGLFTLSEIILQRLQSGPKTAIEICNTMEHPNLIDVSNKLKELEASGFVLIDIQTKKFKAI